MNFYEGFAFFQTPGIQRRSPWNEWTMVGLLLTQVARFLKLPPKLAAVFLLVFYQKPRKDGNSKKKEPPKCLRMLSLAIAFSVAHGSTSKHRLQRAKIHAGLFANSLGKNRFEVSGGLGAASALVQALRFDAEPKSNPTWTVGAQCQPAESDGLIPYQVPQLCPFSPLFWGRVPLLKLTTETKKEVILTALDLAGL